MSKLTRIGCGILVMASLALFGCGGDDGGDGNGGGQPTADFMMSPDCTEEPTDDITFTSTSNDPEDGTDLECSWTFGSCTAPASCTAVDCTVTGVRFPDQAPYNVTLVVTDSDGNSDSISQTIAMCP